MLEPQIPVQPRRGVLLDDEAIALGGGGLRGATGFGRAPKVALLAVRAQRHRNDDREPAR
jgi:hypothetical protein